jgi:hippurate hydrolase
MADELRKPLEEYADEQLAPGFSHGVGRFFHWEIEFPEVFLDADGRRRGDGAALREHFGEDRVVAIPPISASEDFGSFGMEWHAPSVFWTVGGTDAELYANAEREGRLTELPTNHNPRFGPVLHPTLETGVEALVTAACAWLSPA